MRILLTGAKGQIGRAIRERLPEEWELIATDSKTLDITNRAAVLNMIAMFQPDAIINSAAFTSVSLAENDLEKTFAVNAYGPRNLAEAAKEAKARFLHISTDFVFSGRLRIPYTEDNAPNPQSAYGQSKLAGELLTLAANPNSIVLRTSWVFGEHGENSVTTLLKQAANGEKVGLVDNQAACPTYAGDLADAIITLLQQPDYASGILHYSGNRAVSAYQFAQTVIQIERERNPDFVAPELEALQLADIQPPSPRPRYSALNCDKARSLGLEASDWKKKLPEVLAKLAAK
ncbi:MAG: dTDP-4-dehydrorhamnose reductase [Neisseria sp.]|nr:dTDP-4-dehydrorhamnose reductase [Neisseria sp.]